MCELADELDITFYLCAVTDRFWIKWRNGWKINFAVRLKHCQTNEGAGLGSVVVYSISTVV